jgi:hypothetical protein
MEITLRISDNVASEVQSGSETPLGRRLLELAALQAHLSSLITERGVTELLGFEDRRVVPILQAL